MCIRDRRELCTLGPGYISVTYGAGGGTAGQSTAKIASYIKNGLHVEAVSYTHLDVYKRQIYDCGFLPLTGTVSERYALIEPGRTSYHTLFEAIPAELRTQFYASIQRGSPFLMPVTGAAAARDVYKRQNISKAMWTMITTKPKTS